MARADRLLDTAPIAKKDAPQTEKTRPIHYSKLVTSKYQYRDEGKTTEELRDETLDMAAWIEAMGRILEPVIVRKIDTDTYEIISGHTRSRAVKYLVEECQKTQYAFIPCVVVDMADEDAKDAAAIANSRKPSTHAEKMYEIECARRRLEKNPSEESGRMVERLAKACHMSKSTVGEYLTISKNLGEKGMEAFTSGELGKSAAVALSSLPEEEQDKLIDAGVTAHKDIKEYKEEKQQKTVHRTTVTDSTYTEESSSRTFPKMCVTGQSPYGNCVCCGANGVTCCSACTASCNSRCGWSESEKVVDALPGQYRVANIDMDIEEAQVVTNSGNTETTETRPGICDCPNCKLVTRIEDTFKFFNKTYCMNCIYDLLKDLDETGVIQLDAENRNTKGIVVKL